MTKRLRPWLYHHHRRADRRWLARISATVTSFGMHGWIATVLAAITVTFWRFDLDNVPEPQLFVVRGPYQHPAEVWPEHHLDGNGRLDVPSRSRASDRGTSWDSSVPDPEDFARGSEQYVASSELGACQAFMAVGPDQGNAGMFGSRITLTAGPNAQPLPGIKVFAREGALRVALAWIAAQQGADGFWHAADGQRSARLTMLGIISTLRSENGASYRFWGNCGNASQVLGGETPQRGEHALLVWARSCEQMAYDHDEDGLLRAAMTLLLEQEAHLGGWSGTGAPGVIDVHATAWSLFTLETANREDPAIAALYARISAWLAAVRAWQTITGSTSFPRSWDSAAARPAARDNDLLWGAFTVLLADLPEHRTWGETLVDEVLRHEDMEALFADPERLLVHTMLRTRIRPDGWESWLTRVERRLDRTMLRHGSSAGSWTPRNHHERLEYTMWNALVLHEIYAF